jgi:ribosome maturation factor RimP
MNDPVTDRIAAFAEALLPSLGLELYDIQFRREGHGWVLRLSIDKEGGVSLDDCSRVSRETSDFLDVEDFIDHPYHLEVSSPGAERALRTIAECQGFIGELVRIKLNREIEGERVYVGELHAAAEQHLTLKVDDKEIEFSWEDIKKARLTL